MDKRLKKHYEMKYASDANALERREVALRRSPSDRHEAALAALADELPRAGSFLEVGAGDGELCRAILTHRPDLTRAVVSDIAGPRLAGMRSTHADDRRIEVVSLNIEDIDIEIAPVDAVIMVAVIEHLVDPMGALTAIRELLTPNGFVYIDTPNIAKWTRRIKLAAGRFPSTASRNEGLTTYDGEPTDLYDEGHLHYFTYRSLEMMLVGRCGFTRTQPAPYWIDRIAPVVGRRLAQVRPSVFSEVAMFAWR